MTKAIEPYGTWDSALSAAVVAGGARRFGDLQGAGAWIYWSEGRPSEEGRQVIVRAKVDAAGSNVEPAEDVLPAPFSARSRVHEYGGGEFLVDSDLLYFVNDLDQDIYSLDVPGGSPQRLTNEPLMRFARCLADRGRDRLLAVCEVADAEKSVHPENLLVEVDLSGTARGRVTPLVTGHDFFASPCLSPDGTRLVWLAWDLPDMPWDQAGLYVAEMDGDGRPQGSRLIAGGDGAAASQPQWLDDERLVYISDQTLWGNLYVWDGKRSRSLFKADADFARPLWQLGMSSYALDGSGGIIASYFEDGVFRFARIDVASGAHELRQLPFPVVDDLCSFDSGVAGTAGRDDAPPAIVAIAHESNGINNGEGADATKSQGRVPPALLRSAADLELAPGDVSRAQVLTFKGGDGEDVYGLYYPPVHASCTGPEGDLPPAIITVHGGPTASADRGLNLRRQYYTNRGFAVFDVDYAGSAYYGRAYRQRLDGKWGIMDVADCVAAAEYLTQAGLADARRIAIKGGSAGGYTVLMALATSDVFAAGSCHYGISDLELLYAHTHKFESGYQHRLLGTTPDDYALEFAARSPLALIDGITSPVILFQGLDDKVVPPEQSQLIVGKLRAKGLTVAYHEFAGEGHGFRRAETIVTVLNEELRFLREVLGLAAVGTD